MNRHSSLRHIVTTLFAAAALVAPSVAFAQPSTYAHTVSITVDPEIYQQNYFGASLTDVSEGIFGLVDRQGRWSFYNVESGGLIHERIGRQANKNLPRFSGGAALVKEGKNHIILYPDGTKLDLGDQYAKVEDFVDGVAMVKRFGAEFIPEVFYIDKKGRHIYPHLDVKGTSMNSMCATQPVCRLSERLRAVKKDGLWGFIDSEGVMKIKPAFKYVTDFSDGHAWVTVVKDGSYFTGLINTSGDYTIEPKFKGYNSEITKEFGPASNGVVRVILDDGLHYFTTTGRELFKGDVHGSNFTGGYAFVQKAPYDKTYFLVDKDIKTVAEFDDSFGDYQFDDYNPTFAKCGLAVMAHNKAITPGGGIALSCPSDKGELLLRPFSDDGYAFAEYTDKEGNKLAGFIFTDGVFRTLIK